MLDLPLIDLVATDSQLLPDLFLLHERCLVKKNKGDMISLPTMYQITTGVINYSTSERPHYSQEVKAELHPQPENKEVQEEKEEEKREDQTEKSNEVPIFTYLLLNPVPANNTQKSIELLTKISETTNDELYHSKAI